MISALRATAILGAGSVVQILVGLVTAKVYAVFLGAEGLGFMGLLQSLVGLVGLAAGFGLGTATVRLVARTVNEGDAPGTAALWRAAWSMILMIAFVVPSALFLARGVLSRVFLGSEEHAPLVVLLSLPILLALVAGLQTSTLNAHHRVGALAKNAVLISVLGGITSVVLIAVFGTDGILPAIIGVAAVGALVSRVLLMHHVGRPEARATWQQTFTAARRLLTVGVPIQLSTAASTGIGLLLPAIILARFDEAHVGYFRAAIAISTVYLNVLLVSMAQDYFPRLAGTSDGRNGVSRVVNEQHALVMLLGGPLIVAAVAFAPVFVPLIYSAEFLPSLDILQWQLLGDILKFSSWTLSYVVLARMSSLAYFSIEAVGGGVLLAAYWFGMERFGLAGLGIGYLAMYVVYIAVVATLVGARARVFLTHREWIRLGATFAAAASIVGVGQAFGPTARLAYGIAVALTLSATSLLQIAKTWQNRERDLTAPMRREDQSDPMVRSGSANASAPFDR